jgi:hypothetical protein
VTAIANIDSVFLYDVLGAGNPYIKAIRERWNNFCLPAIERVRVFPSAKTLISIVRPARGYPAKKQARLLGFLPDWVSALPPPRANVLAEKFLARGFPDNNP